MWLDKQTSCLSGFACAANFQLTNAGHSALLIYFALFALHMCSPCVCVYVCVVVLACLLSAVFSGNFTE